MPGQVPDLVPDGNEIQGLVGAGILRVAAVEDVGKLGRAIVEVQFEERTEAIGSGRLDRCRPLRIRVEVPGPRMEAPEVGEVGGGCVTVIAIRAVIVDDGEVLSGAARPVDRGVAGLEPGFRVLRRQEAAVFGRVLLVALDER